MAAPQNFRSAFNGFNREDVVHYLEYINTKHNNLVNQLTAENEELRAAVPNPGEAQTVAFLQELCADLTQQLEAEKARCEELPGSWRNCRHSAQSRRPSKRLHLLSCPRNPPVL